MIARLSRWILRRLGFELVGRQPEPEHTVMIASPHTSNWDFPLAMLIGWSLGLKMRWLAKREMFGPGSGWLFRRLGGIPVDRGSAESVVDDMVDLFTPGQRMTIVVPVSGTRGHTAYWKSGFYRIARAANVPVVPAFVDYEKNTCGVGEPIELTGDVGADMDRFRSFYDGIVGKHPANDGPVRLRSEIEPGER